MLNRLVLITVIGVAALASPVASAADWYGEFHVGTTRGTDGSGTERVEGAYGLGIGVQFNEYFSTQLDWHTLGENPDYPTCPILCVTQMPMAEHGYALRALPRLPLGDSFAFELGVGMMRWEGEYSVGGTPIADSGTDPWYSFGAAWRFSEDWSLTVEYQTLDVDFQGVDWTGATLRYRF